jgi:hypothetical protein
MPRTHYYKRKATLSLQRTQGYATRESSRVTANAAKQYYYFSWVIWLYVPSLLLPSYFLLRKATNLLPAVRVLRLLS